MHSFSAKLNENVNEILFDNSIWQRIKVSAGIQLATLRYNSSLPEHSWLRQIMDLFNVEVNVTHISNPSGNDFLAFVLSFL